MSLPKLIRDVDTLKRDMASLRPTFAPGVLTSHTTRGVIRRGNSFQTPTTTTSKTTGARWQ